MDLVPVLVEEFGCPIDAHTQKGGRREEGNKVASRTRFRLYLVADAVGQSPNYKEAPNRCGINGIDKHRGSINRRDEGYKGFHGILMSSEYTLKLGVTLKVGGRGRSLRLLYLR